MKKRVLWALPVILLWLSLCLFAWCKPQTDVSEAERRRLDRFPTLTLSALQTGRYMEDFDGAATDQFPLREPFRRLRAVFACKVLGRLDSHEIYSYDGYLEKLTGPADESSLAYAADRLTTLRETYFPDSRVFLAIVPDKGYFLPNDSIYPTMDYDALFARMEALLPFAEPVELTAALSLDCYYRTDSHWRQERLGEAAAALADALGVTLSGNYEAEPVKTDFRGVYAGQSALPTEAETMYRLTNEVLKNCTITNHETGKTGDLWDWEGLAARDPYDFYLSGAVSLLTIENPAAPAESELVVFRDSFGSSLIPLLAEGYRTITVVDTRYIHPDLLTGLVDFHGQDVLFLYSTTLLNQSSALR